MDVIAKALTCPAVDEARNKCIHKYGDEIAWNGEIRALLGTAFILCGLPEEALPTQHDIDKLVVFVNQLIQEKR